MPVVVVGALKLVLNNHGGTGVILGDQVHAERAGGLLALDIGEVQIDDLVRTSTFSPSAIAASADEALCRRLAELLEANP